MKKSIEFVILLAIIGLIYCNLVDDSNKNVQNVGLANVPLNAYNKDDIVNADVIIPYVGQVTVSSRHRHTHRHRHRHRSKIASKHPVFLMNETHEIYPYPVAAGSREGIKFAIVDEPSIAKLMEFIQVNKTMQRDKEASEKKMDELCSYKERVEDGIQRALNFYKAHLDTQGETAASGLAFTDSVGRKNGKNLLKSFPISSWIKTLCEGVPIKEDVGFCFEYVKTFGSIGETNFARKGTFKKAVQKYDTTVGLEKESLFDELNTACMGALIMRCEVPQACETVMFDPQPRSQYMLTHQLIHRIFAAQSPCLEDKKKYVDPQVEAELCAKIYSEAKLISSLENNVPLTLLRDLFAEQIFFCGFIGYDNFMRVDWLKQILSWQSKSDYGCFLQEDTLTMDIDEIPRKLTMEEIRQGITRTSEVCETHFTSVGLSALATLWDYMEQKC